jgi:hypothetical protein
VVKIQRGQGLRITTTTTLPAFVGHTELLETSLTFDALLRGATLAIGHQTTVAMTPLSTPEGFFWEFLGTPGTPLGRRDVTGVL